MIAVRTQEMLSGLAQLSVRPFSPFGAPGETGTCPQAPGGSGGEQNLGVPIPAPAVFEVAAAR